jgi:hypothetical protein
VSISLSFFRALLMLTMSSGWSWRWTRRCWPGAWPWWWRTDRWYRPV